MPHEALKDAVFLIQHGANYLNDILKPVLYNMPLKIIKLRGLLFSNIKFDEQLKCGYSSISYEDIQKLGISEAEARLGIKEMDFISEFDFVFTLTELENSIKGSFRSKKGIDVSLLAKEFGGGGHKAAAAFHLEKMPLEKAEEFVLKRIKKVGLLTA